MVENLQSSLLGKIAAYTEILATDPRSTIFVSLSEAYRKMGLLDDAYSIARKGLDCLPDYCPGYVVLARIKCQQGEMEASEEAFKKALELDPDNLAALVGFSRLYLLLDRKSEARNLLLKARELSPADSVINKLLLGLPEEKRQPAESQNILDESTPEVQVAAPPESLESATLAELYLKQGMADKALAIYRNLLVRNPDNLEFRRRIRDLEASPGDQDSAERPGPDTEQAVETPAAVEQAVVAESPLMPTLESQNVQSSSVEEESALEQLSRLLVSIQKRRGDV